jgi:hypothetical protein
MFSNGLPCNFNFPSCLVPKDSGSDELLPTNMGSREPVILNVYDMVSLLFARVLCARLNFLLLIINSIGSMSTPRLLDSGSSTVVSRYLARNMPTEGTNFHLLGYSRLRRATMKSWESNLDLGEFRGDCRDKRAVN